MHTKRTNKLSKWKVRHKASFLNQYFKKNNQYNNTWEKKDRKDTGNGQWSGPTFSLAPDFFITIY